MPDHYFTARPESEHHLRVVSAGVAGLTLSFETDAGVFSKGELDPGSRLLIESMPPLSGRVLDLGCGWGAVGVALARLNPGLQLVMSDVNERALALAASNARRNGVEAVTYLSDGFDAVEGLFDHVVTNPPIRAGKAVIYGLFAASRERLKPGGTLTIVIRTQQGAPSALKFLKETFSQADDVARGGGYRILRAVR